MGEQLFFLCHSHLNISSLGILHMDDDTWNQELIPFRDWKSRSEFEGNSVLYPDSRCSTTELVNK